jgi:DNA-directed RNA polymerase subunit M/transcription elongation factor TFIIS
MERDENINKFSTLIHIDIATKIEESIHNFSLDYANKNETLYLLENIYNTKIDEIYNVMTKIPSFINGLLNNTIDPCKVGVMEPDELNPEKYELIKKKKNLEENKKNNQATSNVYQCKKCKNRKCQVTQRQTRAADEPATTFVTCMECHYEFSFN